MKLLVWNINQRSSGQKIPPIVSKVIMDSNADIVVLTECVSSINEENIRIIQGSIDGPLSEKYVFRYNIERKECKGSNGVLIAVKKVLKEKNDAKIASKTKIIRKIEKMNTARTEQPNFLQVDMVVNEEFFSVIGTRIRVTDYEERREQLRSLIDHLNTLANRNIIVAGDFNNGKIYGDESKFYLGKDGVRESYRYTSRGKLNDLYDTYNYHIMKDDFANIGMTVLTPPGKQYSWGYQIDRDGNLDNGCFKVDHIMTNNLKVENSRYCHSFIEDYTREKEWKLNKDKYTIAPPFPDHAILTADVGTMAIE